MGLSLSLLGEFGLLLLGEVRLCCGKGGGVEVWWVTWDYWCGGDTSASFSFSSSSSTTQSTTPTIRLLKPPLHLPNRLPQRPLVRPLLHPDPLPLLPLPPLLPPLPLYGCRLDVRDGQGVGGLDGVQGEELGGEVLGEGELGEEGGF